MADEAQQAASRAPPDPAVPRLNTSQSPQVGSDGRTGTPPSTPSQRKRIDSLGSPLSSESPILSQRQPIRDAVNSAANDVFFENSPMADQLPPDFLKTLIEQVSGQVTEQVFQKLQAAGATPTPSTQANFPPPPPPQQPNEPRSPTQNSVDPGATRFTPPTPPTPERTRNLREERFSFSSSPEPPVSDADSSFSRESHDSVRSGEKHRNSETPRAFNEDTRSRRRSSYLNRRMSGAATEREIPRSQASQSEETVQEPSRRGSRDSETYDAPPTSRTRPVRVPSDVEETPLEKCWQPLFVDGNPTERLSKFLRGLALHIIQDYEPKGSIVVSPAKMLQFLKETPTQGDQYPWDAIFGGSLSTGSISEMYRKLQCQHHLTQDRSDRPPTVPGLTPLGFDWFMTCLIQAHPDAGFDRMKTAAMNMPISNADDKSERFPKQLPRRLFPEVQNIQAQQRLIASLHHEPEIIGRLKGLPPMPPPPPPPTAPPGAFQERERQPYAQPASVSNAVDDDDLVQPSVQIERERKPYTAKEGAGKTYNQDDSRPPASYRELPPRNLRANSGTPSQGIHNNNGPSDPVNIPQRAAHRMSVGQAGAQPQPSNGGYSRSSRRTSPPTRNPHARSEPDFTGSMPNPQSAYMQQGREPYPNDADDEAARRYRSRSRVERSSNPNDDDPRGYSVGGRGVPIANGYEYGSGAGPGGPPIGSQASGAPIGNYPVRRPGMGGNNVNDNRRKSMYDGPPVGYMGGDGGTDGYGSYANGGHSGMQPPQQSYGSSSQH